MSFVYNVDSSPYSTYTDGEWTIRKWDDGVMECWCVHNFDLSGAGQQKMNVWENATSWYCYTYGYLAYPVEFYSVPVCTFSTVSTVSGTVYLYINSAGSTSRTPSIAAGRPTDAYLWQIGANIAFYAIGRWKA